MQLKRCIKLDWILINIVSIMFDSVGRILSNYLSRPGLNVAHAATNSAEQLTASLRKGDVLLIDGNSRISQVIKYLTQSSWSHAALYIGEGNKTASGDTIENVLIEADIREGVRTVPLSTYDSLHTRICRPMGLTDDEIQQVINHSLSRLGHQYDLKNIFDLIRYVIKTPVPSRWKRQMIALGSGDPTRAICSSMIAEAFQSVKYPILPQVINEPTFRSEDISTYKEVLHIRHHSLYVPHDFDISPYFKIVKPTIESDFDPHDLKWGNEKTQ